MQRTPRKGVLLLANCKSNCGCSGCNSYSSGCRSSCSGNASTYTPVGALSTLCRAGGCNGNCNTCGNGCNVCGSNFPFYTGPCPPAPCCNKCGCSTNCNTHCPVCGCTDGTCGCNHHACNTCGGYDDASKCSARSCTGHCGWATNPCCPVCGCTDGTCGCNHHANRHACGCTDNSCRQSGNACHDHHGHGECGCREETWANTGYGVFAVNGPFNVSGGGDICLSARNVNSHFFAINGGNIIIRQPGVYHASVTMDVPVGMDVDTVLQMELDNQRLVPPEIAVTTDSHSSTHNYAGHTMFHAAAGSVLKLSTLNTLCCHNATSHPIITLTLAKITN